LATIDVKMIVSKNISVDDALLSVLLQADTVTSDQKIKLFTMAIPKLKEPLINSLNSIQKFR
jgi:hypothetical protein